VLCRQFLTCERCTKAREKKNAPRIREALAEAWKKETAGGHPKYTMMFTLTVPHDGGPDEQRTKLALGWRRLYKRMNKTGWGGFPYVGVYEVTPGTDGLGHVHMHVVLISPFIPFEYLNRWWREAVPGATQFDVTWSQSPQNAGRYVTKYLAKGMQAGEFSGELAADVVAALYNKKCLFSSVKFFAPRVAFCPCCGCKFETNAGFVFRGEPPVCRIEADGADPPQTAIAFHVLPSGLLHS
jgi:hypothetical protein